MILSCNSCNKKFVVPDQAIASTGRMVQCGSCGNKWKQFPINEIKKKQSFTVSQKVVSKTKNIKQKPKKTKKSSIKKPREISLYSPEYLAKKRGIKINDTITQKSVKPNEKKIFLWFLQLINIINFLNYIYLTNYLFY